MSFLTFSIKSYYSVSYEQEKHDSSDSNFKSRLIRSFVVFVYFPFS